MAEHWEVDASGFNIKEEGKPITVAMTQPHSRMKQRARLIAAAPELLEALKEAVAIIEIWHGPQAWDIYNKASPEMKRINAAIAKATGGAS